MKDIIAEMAEVGGIIVPSNPEDLKNLKKSISDVSDVMTMIKAKQDFITDEVKALSEKYDLPAKFIRKLVRTYHAQTFQKEQQEMEEFELLYESVVGAK